MGAGVAVAPDVPSLLRQLEARQHLLGGDDEAAAAPPPSSTEPPLLAPLGGLVGYEVLLQPQPPPPAQRAHITTVQRLHALGLALRCARRTEAADALDLLVAWLLRAEAKEEREEEEEEENDNNTHSFPALDTLTLLSLLATEPDTTSSSKAVPPLGPLAAGLLTHLRQTTTAPNAVLRTAYRTKQGGVPYVPAEALASMRHRQEEEEEEEESLVYGDRSLLDELNASSLLCGATLYPPHVFEAQEEDEEEEEGEASIYERINPRSSSFLAPQAADVSMFSALRPRRGVVQRVGAQVRSGRGGGGGGGG